MPANPRKPPVIPMDGPLPRTAAPPPPPLADPAAGPAEAEAEAEVDVSRAVVRLLVGSALLGTDELQKRLRAWEDALRAAPPAAPGGEPVSEAELLRYAFIGLLFEAHDQARKSANELFDSVVQAGGAALARLGPLLGSPLLRPLAGPLLQQVDEWVESSAERTARLARLGQREEQHSRLLAERVYAEALDDFIGYLAENPELRALIQSQSVSLATEVQNRFRQTTVDLDAGAETVVRRLLRRAPRRDLPPSPLSSLFHDGLDDSL